MPCWYYDKNELQQTPSIQDGMNYKTECQHRKEGAKFIFDIGIALKLGYNTMATGVIYFHRFYMLHSFKEFPRYVTASACIFLAGKVEETPKMFDDIIKTAKTLLDQKDWTLFGKNPRKEIMTVERILLQTIKFDLLVDHPNIYVPKYAKGLRDPKYPASKKRIERVVQSAWNFARDSLYTTLALQWEPEIMAIAFMYLAGKLGNITLVDGKGRRQWWDTYAEGVTVDLLEDICHQLLDFYDRTNNASSPKETPAENEKIISKIENPPDTPKEMPPVEPLEQSKEYLQPSGIFPPVDFSTPPPPLPDKILKATHNKIPSSNRRQVTPFKPYLLPPRGLNPIYWSTTTTGHPPGVNDTPKNPPRL
ncbi:cyclin-K [Fopius arisanus]|uniref:Cyclin-K n=1 Tax=Fopius arisanus TaxID=64838 RepID=A0A9R1SWW0_9HYME|nr:PREDICTED: cyclin-K-like [Fopius arisanus]